MHFVFSYMGQRQASSQYREYSLGQVRPYQDKQKHDSDGICPTEG